MRANELPKRAKGDKDAVVMVDRANVSNLPGAAWSRKRNNMDELSKARTTHFLIFQNLISLKTTFCWAAIVLLGFVLLSGCSVKSVEYQTRLDADVSRYRQLLNSTRSPVTSKWSKSILSALATVNANNIRQPRLVYGVLSKGNNGTYGLIVFWIEARPSVNRVEFMFSNANSSTNDVLLHIELAQVQNETTVGITFGSETDWRNTSDLYQRLETINATNDLKVRLLRDAKPATDWFRVDFYKAGHWISEVVTNN